MGLEGQKVASLALLHPKSAAAKEKLLASLASRAAVVRRPDNQCLAWDVFTPATRKGAMLGMVPAAEKDTLVGVLQTYASAESLATQQSLGESALGEETVTWHPTAGFIARKDQKETPKAKIVMLAKFVCKDGPGMREKLVDVLGKFCDWVEANEPTTFTYCVMIRPNVPNEVLMFERYKDLPGLGVHGKSQAFKDMFKATGPFVQGRKTVLSEWEELDGSFVSNHPGGAGAQAKL